MADTPAQAGTPSALGRFFALELLDNRYPALHGLRVLAIVSVIQYHVTWILAGEAGVPIDPTFRDASLSIFFGMDLFFLLSGFLIGSILLRSLETTGSQNLRRFYLRRVFRTFPSYYVVLTALVGLFGLTAGQRGNLVYEYVYLTNFRSLLRDDIVMFWGWSLALEEQFYLSVPLLFAGLHRLASGGSRVLLLVGICLIPLAARLYLFYAGGYWNDYILYDTLYFRTPTRFDPIVAGILLAVLEDRYGAAIGRWLEVPLHRGLVTLAVTGCAWLLVRPDLFGPAYAQLMRVFQWGTITSVMWVLALLLLLHGDGWIQQALGHPGFRRAATVGYGVYLVHIPLIDHGVVPAVRALLEDGASLLWVWPSALALVTLASFAIGYALHLVVEKPSMWVRQKLAA